MSISGTVDKTSSKSLCAHCDHFKIAKRLKMAISDPNLSRDVEVKWCKMI